MHTVLECHPLRADDWQTELENSWAFQWWKQLALLRRQATDLWELSHVIRTPARSITSFVSAKLRSIVVSPEVLVSVPCPPHLPVRLQTMARPREWCVQVVRRLPAVPIFRRLGCGHTSPATHHQRKRRRGRRRALTAARAGCGSVSVPMGWLHVQIATVQWASAPATRLWHGTAGFCRSGWCRAVAHQTRCIKWKRREQC